MNHFRCDYCGQFIAYDDIGGENPKAECYMVTPDSEISTETYATHHIACRDEPLDIARVSCDNSSRHGRNQ